MFEYSMNKNEVRETQIGIMGFGDLHFTSKTLPEPPIKEYGDSEKYSGKWNKREIEEPCIITTVRKYISIFFGHMDKKPKTFTILEDSVYLSFDDVNKEIREYIFFKNTIKIIDDVFSKDANRELW